MPGVIPVFYYPLLDFVPTFDSIVANAEFISGGTIESFTDSESLNRHFDYIYGYTLSLEHISDIDAYSFVLIEQHGFIISGGHSDVQNKGIYLYHPEKSITVLLHYRHHDNILSIVIGQGDIWKRVS
jgi:hypothetical protein